MTDHLRRLFRHLEWADERALTALRSAPRVPARALEIYAHVLGAEHLWLTRLEQVPAAQPVWPGLDLEQCARLAAENHLGLGHYLDGLDPGDFAREIAYTNSAGRSFKTPLDDILIHVALHGCYHRGQVALLLRDGGAEPQPTDYIAFVRGAPAATRTGGSGPAGPPRATA
jgi:uncharacterized damage-inducible protein DinB